MLRRSIALVFTFILILNVTGCAQLDSEDNLTVDQLKVEMANDSENLVILDVRTPPELTGPLGKIDGVINIPVQELDKRIGELEKYKDKEIAVICRSGNRSKKGTEILLKEGYNAKNVIGGMKEFRASEKEK